MKLLWGDCLDLMRRIPDGSVDMVLADLPYGITRNSWDKVIPFEPLLEQYRRVIKQNGGRSAVWPNAVFRCVGYEQFKRIPV